MRKLIALTFQSLDGVMQGPGGPSEDTSGGFAYGGWSVPYFDEKMAVEMQSQMEEPFDLLLGRRTYDLFKSYWPQQPADDPINRAVKYVVTNGPLDISWPSTVKLDGDIIGHIRELKENGGPMLQVHGSSELLQLLFAEDLVDEIWLKTFPIVLGKGKRLFKDMGSLGAYELTELDRTPSGVVLAKYRKQGPIKNGEFQL